MTTKPKIVMRPFAVHIPNPTGKAKIIRIEVPVRLDSKSGIEIMTPEAHEIIDNIKEEARKRPIKRHTDIAKAIKGKK